MASSDSDDYEIMPMQELEDLRREVNALKRNNLTEGDKAKLIIESMDRLAVSINRLISILDDAQRDIIDEYQQAKPVETLHQIAEQNEMIARALISISDNVGGKSVFPSAFRDEEKGGNAKSILPTNFDSSSANNNSQNNQGQNNMPKMQQNQNFQNQNSYNQQNNSQNNRMTNSMASPLPDLKNIPDINTMGPGLSGVSMPPMDDMPPMDNIPPLNNPSQDKKKFLGIL